MHTILAAALAALVSGDGGSATIGWTAHMKACVHGTQICGLFDDSRGPYGTKAECEARLPEMLPAVVQSFGGRLGLPNGTNVETWGRCRTPKGEDA